MASKTSTSTSIEKNSTDAIAILKADHAKVKKLFKQFEEMHQSGDDDEAEEVATRICNELKIHATVEEEIFYPAVRAATKDEDLMDEAEVEHQSAKDMIAQIESEGPSGDKHAAKVKVLGEYIDHHVEEEQNEMFPKAKRTRLDMNALGLQILTRKEELKTEMGIEDDEQEEEQPAPSSRGGRNASTAARK